jgi:hypothetical protein
LRPKWLVVTVSSVSALSWMRRHRSRNFIISGGDYCRLSSVGSQFRWHLARGVTSEFPPVSHSDGGRFVSWMASFSSKV